MKRERVIKTDIPARLDRLPWSYWHWLVVIGLGITWLLDGLEVTLAGSLAGILQNPQTLGLSNTQIGLTATAYLAGAVVGAVIFGYATDRLGRKRLFVLTLMLYLSATAATAFAWNFWTFALFRVLTGAGIGGEYAAINSAIDELVPARVRGRVDLAINATFWIGAALGSGASILLLDSGWFAINVGWRLAFGLGAAIGLGILALRRFVPESPRWLILHGEEEQAEQIVHAIELEVAKETSRKGINSLPKAEGTLELHVRDHTPLGDIWRVMVHDQRQRSLLGLALMVAQAFFYNSVFFTTGLVLISFYHVPAGAIGYYLLPLALGNFLGPLLLGPLFDSLGRRPMIVATYALSGLLVAVAAALFAADLLTPVSQTLLWAAVFFIASSAASSAYLTVSEIFPLEIRALAIAVFYSLGTLVGGVAAPAIFGLLINTHSRPALMWGYFGAAALMLIAALVEAILGIKAERQPLESISAPLSSR
jgi:MFS family permease